MHTRRAALYLRVSTDRQETECQRPDVEQLARVRGFEVVKVFEEKMSAAKVRPEYAKMMKEGARQRPHSPRLGSKPLDLRCDARHGGSQVAHHELRIEPQHAVPRPSERPIPPRIGRRRSRVAETIDLDDEFHLESQEVDDEPTEQRYLSTKRDAQLPTAHRVEDPSLGQGGSAPHRGRALGEHRLSMSRGA